MVDSGTVSCDASIIETLFNQYQESMNSINNESIWQGYSKDNAISKSEEFVSNYKSTINNQMISLAKAVDLFKEYKAAKEAYEAASEAYAAAIANEDNAGAAAAAQEMAMWKAKMDQLKPQIESTLNEIVSLAKNEVKSGGAKGEFVNFYQGNYQNSYGYGTTIASSGCGPTSMAMILTSMTGSEVTPVTTADYSLKNGYRVEGNGTAWSYFDSISEKYGLECEQSEVNGNKIKSDLQEGKEIIMSMGPGTFTKGGHFIVLKGINDDGTINVADPASESRSNESYDVGVFVNEGRQQWSFSS